MTRISMAEARRDLADILNRAQYSRERFILTRHDSEVAAIISVEELRLLDALLERYEDEADVADARAAMLEAREERVAWDAVKSEFGL
ncbi:MAG: type II toxin-antitoxin system Phd/YefM family antitoxin [Coriobacteriia bacterium]